MNIEKIKSADTKYIGKEIEYYETINSTHIKAKENNKKLKNGTIIIAQTQTGAIGTKGRVWYTGDNNIAMSILLKPKCNIDKLNGLTIKIAKIMKESIYNLYGYNLDIKEPNDLILNGKKISGILTQTATNEGIVEYLIISIGFNVNEICFSKETLDIATSLKRQYKEEYNREDIICEFIELLENSIEKIY